MRGLSLFQAGASQVIFTNPIEIVKIRLQVAGETGKDVERSQGTGFWRSLQGLKIHQTNLKINRDKW